MYNYARHMHCFSCEKNVHNPRKIILIEPFIVSLTRFSDYNQKICVNYSNCIDLCCMQKLLKCFLIIFLNILSKNIVK